MTIFPTAVVVIACVVVTCVVIVIVCVVIACVVIVIIVAIACRIIIIGGGGGRVVIIVVARIIIIPSGIVVSSTGRIIGAVFIVAVEQSISIVVCAVGALTRLLALDSLVIIRAGVPSRTAVQNAQQQAEGGHPTEPLNGHEKHVGAA